MNFSKPVKPLPRAALAASLFVAGCAPSGAGGEERPFDFYVLALSWSPSYCAAEGPDANRVQCEEIRPDGFVVHGLWPQFEDGWPEFCASEEPERVPQSIVGEMIDLMPSGGLIGHQWRKHGTCTGLSQKDYFEATRAAWERIEIPSPFNDLSADMNLSPEEAEAAFMAANPGLPADGIAVTCRGALMSEVRICMETDGTFRSCPQVDARACTRAVTELPAVR